MILIGMNDVKYYYRFKNEQEVLYYLMLCIYEVRDLVFNFLVVFDITNFLTFFLKISFVLFFSFRNYTIA